MPLSRSRLVKYTTIGRLFRGPLDRFLGRLQPLLLMAYDSLLQLENGLGLKTEGLSRLEP